MRKNKFMFKGVCIVVGGSPKAVCDLIERGVAAIIGPQSGYSVEDVASICESVHIPFIMARPNYRGKNNAFTFNIYPHADSINKALASVSTEWGWNYFMLVYERDEDLIGLQSLLEVQTSIYMTELPKNPKHYIEALKMVRESGKINIVFGCAAGRLVTLFRQARELGMLSGMFNFAVASLDLNTVDLEEFSKEHAFIAGLRLVNRTVQSVKGWKTHSGETQKVRASYYFHIK
ncbi:hypothetical protein ACJJTC_014306 [Scirpophaga incertulas]